MIAHTNAVRQMLPLSLVTAGETVEFADIQGQGPLRQRLSEMGLTPGTVIRVVQADPTGGMIVAVRHDSRLAIGRSTAHKIHVYLSGER